MVGEPMLEAAITAVARVEVATEAGLMGAAEVATLESTMVRGWRGRGEGGRGEGGEGEQEGVGSSSEGARGVTMVVEGRALEGGRW